MRPITGYQFYQRVRARQDWISIPFIFLTVKTSREDMLRAKALGVEDYLTKPFDPQELLVTVRAQLARSEALEEAAGAEMEELKDQIVKVLGHELRTPLTYIRCYADLARESASRLPNGNLEKHLSGLRHGADRLTVLAEDIVLLTQLGTKHAEEGFWRNLPLCHDLGEVLEDLAPQYARQAAEHGVTLTTTAEPDLPPVCLHPPYFANALGRLIDNAIKFSHEADDRVIVSARRVRDWVEVAVSDEGVGIPAEKIPTLFERFRQIGRQEMEQQGMGLGLVIARRLIDLHHGEITVESTAGRGSTFTIRLPAADAGPGTPK
jgi:signal transduction histidine kinase